ncbi:MAG: TIM barrel protein [Planctomycetales bacterium]|nr:TIM barrel protein [Planctomycetales bacterium]
MNRRSFVAAGTAAALFGTAVPSGFTQDTGSAKPASRFKLKYAPAPGMFRNLAGDDLFDQIKFIHDQGFGAIFDNGLMGKSPEMQEKTARTLTDLGMDLGPFVLYADFGAKSFVQSSPDTRQMLIDKAKQGVETARRTGAKWALMVPGRYDESLEWDYQTANVIENLKHCADVCQQGGLTIVLEPLNPHDHPGLFLTKIPQAYQICKAVNSPACKIINDLYHQQITEGNLIPNINRAWSEIAAFHLGDNPGRQEPGTGEINFKNIFRYLHEKGYTGVLCMEHGIRGKGKEGEQALLDAYRECDNF